MRRKIKRGDGRRKERKGGGAMGASSASMNWHNDPVIPEDLREVIGKFMLGDALGTVALLKIALMTVHALGMKYVPITLDRVALDRLLYEVGSVSVALVEEDAVETLKMGRHLALFYVTTEETAALRKDMVERDKSMIELDFGDWGGKEN